MSYTETGILRLALLAYEAAAEPALWPRFLELYNDAISSDAVLFQIHDLSSNRSTILSGFGISSPFQQSYNEHYSKLNVWRERGRALYVPGSVNLDQELCSRFVFERSEFYNDYLRRMDTAYSLGAVIARHQNQVPTLTGLRGYPKGPYGEDEREIAKFLLPYLARAWTVYEKLDVLAAGESVLDRLPLGIIFLKAGGVVTYSNQCAEEILCAADGFSLRNSMLRAEDRSSDAQLRKALHHALSPDLPLGPQAVGVPRNSGRRPYQVVIAPLRTRFPQFAGAPAPMAAIFITDPDRPGLAKKDLLIQLYGLTPKEAQMTVELSEAKSVEQVADRLGITYQTARTHLRHIFSKTGTSRQSELILLVAKIPGGGRG